jgi:D-beta-D-heptose 7-phosphate kinase/D-beta-D-heptose 1-phosphate adenosyltransferase
VKKVLVIGDVISDIYRDCVFKKMCPDAPSVKAMVVHSTDVRPGGAANVAVNLAALAPEARIHLIGEVDGEVGRMTKYLSKHRVNLDHCEYTEKTVTKERICLDGELLLRMDSKARASSVTAEGIEWHLQQYFANNDPDLIILSDYGNESISEGSFDMLMQVRDRLLVDTKLTELSRFRSGDSRTFLLKLNDEEYKNVLLNHAEPEKFFGALIVTHGANGSTLRVHEQRSPAVSVTHRLFTPSHNVEAIDVCGCGDTYMAGLAASLLENDDYFTAMQFANAAAATVVTQARTAVADLGETKRLLERWDVR